MSLSIIVAMSRNRVIGRQNRLPWHLPEDLKHFKATTMGHPILMGRKTFASIGRALPGRENLLLTRNDSFQAENIRCVHSLKDALDLYPDQEIFIIGGESVYRLALPQTQKIYLTLIDEDFEGDTYFPPVDYEKDFEIIEESKTRHSQKNGLPYRFLTAIRRQSPSKTSDSRND